LPTLVVASPYSSSSSSGTDDARGHEGVGDSDQQGVRRRHVEAAVVLVPVGLQFGEDGVEGDVRRSRSLLG
jgi:hypothetical protein